ncbi:glycosyltransferase family 2 protein [Kineococcus glutinatus]|uniref:Glycosyltransferase 2-like domain-containing protein n=1 Tax=Kineococcus glutinatus TaxID=1070872 RepID=A0ABP9HVP5_9ACTN
MSERTKTDAVNAAGRAPRVSVVIPTYNEAANLPHVFKLLPADLHEVIVVDGRSTDATVETARALRSDVKIVLQNRRGKGNAMACGFAAVTGDIVVMLDADGSADPREIPAYVAALTAGADFAKGSRFIAGGGSSDITALRKAGNWCLNTAANVLFGTRYTDLCYGYNAFWADCLPVLELDPTGEAKDAKQWGDGFEIETLINTRIAKAKLDIREVPSFEFDRIHGESNLNTFRDGFRVLTALVIERTRPGIRKTATAPRPVGAPVAPAVPAQRAEVIDLRPASMPVSTNLADVPAAPTAETIKNIVIDLRQSAPARISVN